MKDRILRIDDVLAHRSESLDSVPPRRVRGLPQGAPALRARRPRERLAPLGGRGMDQEPTTSRMNTPTATRRRRGGRPESRDPPGETRHPPVGPPRPPAPHVPRAATETGSPRRETGARLLLPSVRWTPRNAKQASPHTETHALAQKLCDELAKTQVRQPNTTDTLNRAVSCLAEERASPVHPNPHARPTGRHLVRPPKECPVRTPPRRHQRDGNHPDPELDTATPHRPEPPPPASIPPKPPLVGARLGRQPTRTAATDRHTPKTVRVTTPSGQGPAGRPPNPNPPPTEHKNWPKTPQGAPRPHSHP